MTQAAIARRVGFADDHDRVGRILGREPVGGTERRRVGQRRVAREELIRHAERSRGARRARPGRRRRSCWQRYHHADRYRSPRPASRHADRPGRLPGALRLAPRAGADRLPRRRRLARGARAARGRHLGGRARLPYDQAFDRAMGAPSGYDAARARVLRRGVAGPAAGAAPVPRRSRDILDEFRRPAGGRPDERPAPAPVRLLHAAAAADVDDGRAARPGDQPGRRRLACRAARRPSSRRRSSAGCATWSGTDPARSGC